MCSHKHTYIYSDTINAQLTSLEKPLVFFSHFLWTQAVPVKRLKSKAHAKLFLQRVLYYSSPGAFRYQLIFAKAPQLEYFYPSPHLPNPHLPFHAQKGDMRNKTTKIRYKFQVQNKLKPQELSALHAKGHLPKNVNQHRQHLGAMQIQSEVSKAVQHSV